MQCYDQIPLYYIKSWSLNAGSPHNEFYYALWIAT